MGISKIKSLQEKPRYIYFDYECRNQKLDDLLQT